jgi:hypothetical protein
MNKEGGRYVRDSWQSIVIVNVCFNTLNRSSSLTFTSARKPDAQSFYSHKMKCARHIRLKVFVLSFYFNVDSVPFLFFFFLKDRLRTSMIRRSEVSSHLSVFIVREQLLRGRLKISIPRREEARCLDELCPFHMGLVTLYKLPL